MLHSCNGCRVREFDLEHVLFCKTGHLMTRIPIEVRDILEELFEEAWGNNVD